MVDEKSEGEQKNGEESSQSSSKFKGGNYEKCN